MVKTEDGKASTVECILPPFKGICSGYAKAMIVALKHLGIEAEYVTSKRHGFLRAKLGENWIMLDPTWDEGEKVYEYFASEKLHNSRDKYHIPVQDLSQCSFVTLPQQFVNRLVSIVDNKKVNKKSLDLEMTYFFTINYVYGF